MKGTIASALKKTFSPEFLNRLDDVIVFNSLAKEDIHKIIDISLAKLLGRVKMLGYTIEITDKAKDFVAEKGYDSKYGARPLNRAITKYMEDPIAEEILKAELAQGDVILIDYKEGEEELTFTNRKGEKSDNIPDISDEITETPSEESTPKDEKSKD